MTTDGLIKRSIFVLIFCSIIWLVLPIPASLAQSPPSFGNEIYSFATGSTDSPPGTCAISSNVSVGQRVVVIAVQDSNVNSVSGVTDTQGNTYSQMLYYNNTNYQNANICIWSAYVLKPLVAGTDTITLTWNPDVTTWRAYAVSIVTVNNTAQNGQPDSTAENNAYLYSGHNPSIPGTTVAVNTVIVGAMLANDFVWTPGAGWTIYDSKSSNIYYDFFQSAVSNPGQQDPGGTAPSYNTFAGAWVAFKPDSGAPLNPTISLSTNSLSFNTVQGANPNSQMVSLSNSGGGTLTWTATAAPTWLSVAPASGQGDASLTVSVNSSSLSPGTYYGTITISATGATNTPQRLNVTLTVTPDPAIQLSSNSLFFSTIQGVNPNSQMVSLSNSGGGTLTWTATADSTLPAWLSVTPTSGENNANLNVSVNSGGAGLSIGNYTKTITIAAPGATNTPQTLSVTVTVNPPSTQSPPSFGNEIYSFATGSTDSPPGTCAISSNVSVGQRVVVIAVQDSNVNSVSGVTDTQGNTYSQMLYYNNTNYQNANICIWSAYVLKPLVAGTDTITLTWNPDVTTWRAYAVSIVTVNNTAQNGQPDSTAENNAYLYSGHNPSIPGTTVAVNTVIVGAMLANDFVWTPGAGWTIYDSKSSNIYYDFFQSAVSNPGQQDPGGTAPSYNTFAGAWVGFK